MLSRLFVFRFSGVIAQRLASTKASDQDPESFPEQPHPKAAKGCLNCEELAKDLENSLVEQKELDAKVSDLTDKYKRALADTENVRHRLMKQAEDAKVFAVQSFAKDLLAVADSLVQAEKSVSATAHESNDPNFKALFEGLKLTDNQLHQVFGRHGLHKVCPKVGDKFDPKIHEALFQQDPTKGETSGTISDVQKIGYLLKERCLRPAIVGVFK